jgi:hypothetical protein
MKRFLAFLCLFILNIPLSHSAVVIYIVETGGDVQATLSGNIDLLALDTSNNLISGWDGFWVSDGIVGFNSDSGNVDFYPIDVVRWPALGAGCCLNVWDSSSGDAVAMFGDPALGLPPGYVSGDPLSATATKNSTDFATLGFIPGTYETTLTNGSVTDTLTVNVGVAPPATYTVGGTVSGLTGSVTLQNNVGDDIIKTTNDGFTFTAQAEGSDYAVTVSSQPSGQTCSVGNGSGTNITANITNVSVACIDDVVAPPPVPMVPIPTLSQWALILLTMLLGLMVFANRRRLF